MNEAKLQPQAIEFEEAILGNLIFYPDTFSKVSELISTDMFYKEENGIIYSHIFKMQEDGKPIDMITVVESIRTSGELAKIGGAYYISTLQNRVTSSNNLISYANTLQKYWAKRALIAILGTFSNNLYQDTTEPLKVAESLNNSIFDIVGKMASKSQLIPIGEMVESFAEKAKKEQKEGIILSGLDTGSKGINDITGGFNRGELIVIAARPGMGKTVRAWKFLVDSCKSGIFFSLEMNESQLATRIVAGRCGITLDDIKKRNIPDHVWGEVDKLLIELKDTDISIQTLHGIKLNKIKADCKNHILKYGSLDMIVVDYIQIMGTDEKGNREQEISKLSRGLKNIAKEFDVPVIALAQLNRSLEQRPNKRPELSDLRESGSIEQDADIVSFIYRPSYYADFHDGCMGNNGYTIEENPDNWGMLSEFIIKKNRQGDKGIVLEKFIGAHATFRDFEKQSFEINPQDLEEDEPF